MRDMYLFTYTNTRTIACFESYLAGNQLAVMIFHHTCTLCTYIIPSVYKFIYHTLVCIILHVRAFYQFMVGTDYC